MLGLSRLERLAYYPVAILGLVLNLISWSSEFYGSQTYRMQALSAALIVESAALAVLWLAPLTGSRRKPLLRGALFVAGLLLLARVGLFLFLVIGSNFAS